MKNWIKRKINNIMYAVNRKFQKKFKKDHVKKTWHKDDKYLKKYPRFENTIKLVNICSAGDFLSKLIGFFSSGFSHTIPIYFGDLTKILNDRQIAGIQKNLNNYYKNPPEVKEIKSWVIGTADETGLNFCDLSVYNKRKKVIYNMPTPSIDKRSFMFEFAINQIGKPYDTTGLLMKLLNLFKIKAKMLDDKISYFCSEFSRDFFKVGGIKISKKDNPEPGEIDKYNAKRIVIDER